MNAYIKKQYKKVIHFTCVVLSYSILCVVYVVTTTKYEYNAQSFNLSLSLHTWVICRQRPRGQTLRVATSSHAAERGSDVTPPRGYVAAADSSSWLWRRSTVDYGAAFIHRDWSAKKITRVSLLKYILVTCFLHLKSGSSWLPLLTMETCSNSHKKQKLSNTAENWVSVGTSGVSAHQFLTFDSQQHSTATSELKYSVLRSWLGLS